MTDDFDDKTPVDGTPLYLNSADAPTVEEAPPTPSLAKRLKDAVEQGKSLGSSFVLVVAAASAIYSFLHPEEEARDNYTILKPVVEATANDVRELRIRLDYFEKLMLMNGHRTGAPVTVDSITFVQPDVVAASPPGAEGEAEEMDASEPLPPAPPVDLPDAPWDEKH